VGHVAHMGERINVCDILVGKPVGKKPLGGPGHKWENTEWILGKQVGKVQACGRRQGPIVGSCEHNNEPLGSIKDREFLD